MTELEVTGALAACRAAWPDVRITDAQFGDFVAARVPGPGAVGDLALTDLYLACGCAHGDPAAVAGFRGRFASQVSAIAARFDASPDFADELLQDLYCRLFLEPEPKIAGYEGRGQLDPWIRVVAARMAIDRVRRESRLTVLTDSVEVQLDALSADPGSMLLAAAHRRELKIAFEQASRVLTRRERAVLRYSLDGATAEDVARVYGVHRVSVSRWLGAIREKLKAAIASHLELSLTGADRPMLSIDQITLSLDRLLPRAM